jgi:hypothetical protein
MTAVSAYTSHSRSAEVMNRKPSASTARTKSVPTMIHLRLKRSAATPATGLSTNSDAVCAIMTPPSARPEAPVSFSTK